MTTNKKTPPNAPWKFIKGAWTGPNRVACIRPAEPLGWALFLQVELVKEARCLQQKQPYTLINVPAHLTHKKAYIKREVGLEGHIIVFAETQEELLQVMGILDPEYGIKADQALQGNLPVRVSNGMVVISHRDGSHGDYRVTDPETLHIEPIAPVVHTDTEEVES